MENTTLEGKDKIEELKKLSAKEDDAVMICRVSSKEQADGYSLEAQTDLIKSYAENKGLNILETFDFFESAGKKERTKFNQAIEYIILKGIKKILVEKTDRLYRNFRDYVLMEDLIDGHNMEIHFVKENEVWNKNSTSHAKMVHTFKVMMAKNYLDNLSEEVKKGLNKKAELGLYPGSPPFGYKQDIETKVMIPHPEESVIVKEIFQKYLTGEYSIYEISHWLNERGMKTNRKCKFSKSTVHRILTQRLYIGEFTWNAKTQQGKHEPLIDYAMFRKCQELLTDGAHRIRGQIQVKKYPLSKFLYSEDGRKFTGEKQKGHTYYGAFIPNSPKAKRFYIREEDIFKGIDEVINSIEWSEVYSEQVQAAAQEIFDQKKRFKKAEVRRANNRLRNFEAQIDRLLDLFLSKGITKEMFMNKEKAIRNLMNDQQALIDDHDISADDFRKMLVRVVDAFTLFPRIYRKLVFKDIEEPKDREDYSMKKEKVYYKERKDAYFYDKALLINELIDKIIVNYDKSVRVVFAPPICYWINDRLFPADERKTQEAPEKVRERLFDRGRRDSNPRLPA